MKYLLLSLFLLCIFTSCSDEKSKNKPKAESKFANKEQIKPKIKKHVVNPEAENVSIEELLKIDKELPVIEVIIPKSWTQVEIDKLGQLDILRDVTFIDCDLSDKNINFISKRRSLKTLTFENCKLNNELFGTLTKTIVEKISFKRSTPTPELIAAMKKAPRLKEISTTGDTSAIKAAFPNMPVTQIQE